MNTIPFNKTYITGNELKYIAEVISSGKLSGDGPFSKRCQQYLEDKYGFKKCLLTTSCTDALEMAAILLNIQPNDEVIIPSYTFVSTANAFVLRGAKIIFADSEEHSPNIDASKIESLITPQTKAIVVVHYGGIACEMDEIMSIANRYNLFVVEDAAQAIDAFYKGRPLGSIGHLAAFSFHETKNIVSGEGGMLVINDLQFLERAEIIRDKGTNRGMFSRGEVDKYEWVDVGSSYLPGEIVAAFLYAQIKQIDKIQEKRKELWKRYQSGLLSLVINGRIAFLPIEEHKKANANLFPIITKSEEERKQLILFLKANDVVPAFHYLSLHRSPFSIAQNNNQNLANSDKFTNCLLRLPFYTDLSMDDVDKVVSLVVSFYNKTTTNP
jgi:dTDP-4-amino-4,6-dideoxygalactose transaminase